MTTRSVGANPSTTRSPIDCGPSLMLLRDHAIAWPDDVHHALALIRDDDAESGIRMDSFAVFNGMRPRTNSPGGASGLVRGWRTCRAFQERTGRRAEFGTGEVDGSLCG